MIITIETVVLSESLLAGVEVDPRWATGPFMGLKLMPAKAKGKRFEQIAQAVLESRGHRVERPLTSDHDRLVDSEKYEIKGSTITKGSDSSFSFLQIRPAQDYEYLLLETFWFDGTIKYYRIPKSDVVAFIELGVFKPQHGGNSGHSGTFCYNGELTPFSDHYWFTVKIESPKTLDK